MDKKQFYKNLPTLATSRLIIRKMRLNDLDDILNMHQKKKWLNIYVGINMQRYK